MKRYVFAGILVLLIVLLVTFPARVAYQWFAPPDLTLSGISGSVWSGSAAEGLAGGAYIQDISWTLQPSALLSGKLAFDTVSRPASGTMQTRVAAGLNGALTFSDLSGSVPLDLVHPAFQQGGISGDLRLDFETLTLQNGVPVDAKGSIVVSDFFARDLSAGAIGDFRADIETVDGGISGRLDDVSGVLDIEGTIVLSADRTYSLIGDVAARPGAPPSIEQQLRYLGSADERGFRQFRFEGSL